MRIGFSLPQVGPFADPRTLVDVAVLAENLGYDSLWVMDRLLWPTDPRAPYPATPDGSLPEVFKTVLDPMEALTFAAAHTDEVDLGTGILDLPYYNPVILSRQLATLDQLSEGRLIAGFGNGWSPDEFEAVNVPMEGRGNRANEALEVLKTIWTQDPCSHEGEYFRLPESHVFPKPVQDPHPPIYMSGYVEAAQRRAAEYADGWLPTGIPLDQLGEIFNGIREMAEQAGRDPAQLNLVVRANLYISEDPREEEGAEFTGTVEQIEGDIAAAEAAGTDELIIEGQFSPGVRTAQDLLDLAEQFHEVPSAG